MAEITQELLRELLDYNPETGVLTWKKRDRKWFKTNNAFIVWNSRSTGKEAGCVGHNKATGKKYGHISIFNRLYLKHRIIWIYVTGETPNQIDHIDGNGLNNKLENLRDVTQSGNQRNKRMGKNNTSGVVGVNWVSDMRKWRATIRNDGRLCVIGYFEDIKDACLVRKKAEKERGYHENHGSIRPL